MNIANHLLDLTASAATGALTGMYAGPLGASGGALAGVLAATSFKTVQYVHFKAEKNEKNAHKKNDLLNTSMIIAIVAIFASAYAAAAVVGVEITFFAVCWVGLASIPASVAVDSVKELVETAFFPKNA